MAQGNVELIRQYYADVNAGNLDAALTALSPQIEFRPVGVFPDLDDLYRGHAEFLRFAGDFFEPWEQLSLEPEQFIDLGDRVLVPLRFHATGRDGIETRLAIFQLWTIEDGKAVRLDAYADGADVAAALGFSSSPVR